MLKVIWDSNFTKWVISVLRPIIYCGSLCVIILYLLFLSLPEDAYYEYNGNFSTIELKNLSSPSLLLGAPFVQELSSSLAVNDVMKIRFFGGSEMTFYASPITWDEKSWEPPSFEYSSSFDELTDTQKTKLTGRNLCIRISNELFHNGVGYLDLDPFSRISKHLNILNYDLVQNTLSLSSSWQPNGNIDLSITKQIPQMPVSGSSYKYEEVYNRSNIIVKDFDSTSRTYVNSYMFHEIDGIISRVDNYSDIKTSNFVRLVGCFKIYDADTNELIFSSVDYSNTSQIELYNYVLYAENYSEIHVSMYKETQLRGLNHFSVDSFLANNEDSGSIIFRQSANEKTYEISNIPVSAEKYGDQLTGKISYENGELSVNISGVVKKATISNFSLFITIRQWIADNSLIVASTILSSFIGLFFTYSAKNEAKSKSNAEKEET